MKSDDSPLEKPVKEIRLFYFFFQNKNGVFTPRCGSTKVSRLAGTMPYTSPFSNF